MHEINSRSKSSLYWKLYQIWNHPWGWCTYWIFVVQCSHSGKKWQIKSPWILALKRQEKIVTHCYSLANPCSQINFNLNTFKSKEGNTKLLLGKNPTLCETYQYGNDLIDHNYHINIKITLFSLSSPCKPPHRKAAAS